MLDRCALRKTSTTASGAGQGSADVLNARTATFRRSTHELVDGVVGDEEPGAHLVDLAAGELVAVGPLAPGVEGGDAVLKGVIPSGSANNGSYSR